MNDHDEDHDELVRHADDAYEAIRALNHRTWRAIPAPLAYGLLGNLTKKIADAAYDRRYH